MPSLPGVPGKYRYCTSFRQGRDDAEISLGLCQRVLLRCCHRTSPGAGDQDACHIIQKDHGFDIIKRPKIPLSERYCG